MHAGGTGVAKDDARAARLYERACGGGDLAACSERLETLQRKGRRSDPALNTLLAMGAVAGGRPLPPFRVPSAVHPIIRATAKE